MFQKLQSVMFKYISLGQYEQKGCSDSSESFRGDLVANLTNSNCEFCRMKISSALHSVETKLFYDQCEVN